MELSVTLREILNKGDWDAFCDDTGTNPWCLSEGSDGDCKVTLTIEQAKKYKLLRGD